MGLTAFLVNAGNAHGTWPTPRYHSLLLLLLFCAAWTVFFSSAYILWLADNKQHILANVASSIIWLGVTLVLWGVGAGILHFTRGGGNCPNSAPISRCRQSLTVESLAWVETGVVFLTLCWTITTTIVRRDTLDSRRIV
ncbi:hypothetical protein MIND_00487600 [Mycena indigotica]|uniref:MARVEL domain-containing protein n=1 Tax=Mycena indigotica TaxID=2126181 RepID=A0A8H6W9T3_9AGAR|nr:uncharacterized protein MIND_00487600 [Mycena indigotica]KAF7306948.1 hypothetical protein MIND_00487600 [Mycena indigotica]